MGTNQACPRCGSVHTVKDGRSGKVQRFRCMACRKRFSEHTGTILENSTLSLDAWRAVAKSLVAGESVEKTSARIAAYGVTDWRSAWAARASVMRAVGRLPKCGLEGVAQFGIMHINAGRKGSRENGAPAKARKGEHGSVLVALGVDERGMCAMAAGAGVPTGELVRRFVEERACGVEVACSNGGMAYKHAFERMGVAHYVKPQGSDAIMRTVLHGGWEAACAGSTTASAEIEELQRLEIVEHVRNAGELGAREFVEMRDGLRLSTDDAVALMGEVKRRLVTGTAGVSAKHVPLYVGWAEYLHNLRVEHGEVEDELARCVLEDALSARVSAAERAEG